MVKKALIWTVMVLTVLVLAAWAYFAQASYAEVWLLLNRNIATEYAKGMLVSSTTLRETPDDLWNVQISSLGDRVEFISHDQDKFFVLLYKPGEKLQTFDMGGGHIMNLRDLKEGWYEVEGLEAGSRSGQRPGQA